MRGRIYHVGGPVGPVVEGAPCTFLDRDGVEVFVGPAGAVGVDARFEGDLPVEVRIEPRSKPSGGLE